MTRKDFKLISHALKILEMPILSKKKNLTQENLFKSRMVTASSSWDSVTVFASDDSNSNFYDPEKFQTHFSRSKNIRNANFVQKKFFLTQENLSKNRIVTVSSS
jgi:hypothetical protein